MLFADSSLRATVSNNFPGKPNNQRGRENLHELKVSHFAANTDDKGCVYIY